VRFLACLAIADLVQAGASRPELVRTLSPLITWDGPSSEDWAALLAAVCADDTGPGITRSLPRLAGVGAALCWPGSGCEQKIAVGIASLHALYAALEPVLQGWDLREAGAGGASLMGSGNLAAAAGDHRHVGMGTAKDVVLVHADGASLPFGALLWAKRCAVCGEQQIFFHDRACARRKIAEEPELDLLAWLRTPAGRRKDAASSWTRRT